jgi:predicted helicase
MALLRPDAKHNWLNVTANDFEEFLPVAARATKVAKRPGSERAIFKAFSLGISTYRDEWFYDRDRKNLQSKVQHLIEAYDRVPADTTEFPDTLKWSRNLKRRLKGGAREAYLEQKIVLASYRPYSRRWLYQAAEALFTPKRPLSEPSIPESLTSADHSVRKPCSTRRILQNSAL